MTRFVDLLLAEARLWRDAHFQPAFRTLFFGGGTPSLLPLEPMRRLIEGLHATFDLSGLEEFTIEVNPATADLNYCRMLRDLGVNRLSFGAQSFDPAELASLERHHDPADVTRSLDLARAAGFTRLSLDLIFALPNQSMDAWMTNLEKAIELDTEHLSCYALTYEPNTPMGVQHRLGRITGAPEELELAMLYATRDRLAQVGYEAYEVSNFARPGAACRHNLVYWRGGSYLALGPSGAGHIAGTRLRNQPHLGKWEEAVAAGRLPAIDVEHLTPVQRLGERVMLGLRLAEGVPYVHHNLTSPDNPPAALDVREVFARELAQLSDLGLIALGADHFALTRAGIATADAVAAEFLGR